MQVIPQEKYTNRDQAALLEFLSECKRIALKRNHFQIASISIKSKYMDPLAVLQSIWEPSDLYFYLEHPLTGEAIAGAESVVSATFGGPERFDQAKAFALEIAENTIAIGDTDLPGAGPRVFCGFTFFDRADFPFAPATLFVPAWQTSSKDGYYLATANVKVAADSEIEPLAKRIWAAHAKLSSTEFSPETKQPCPLHIVKKEEVGGDGWYEAAVGEGIAKIAEGHFRKIVLARAIDLTADRPFDPLDSLNTIRNTYQNGFPCAFGNGRGQSFIAAAPERLVKVDSQLLETEAVAGTRPRGATAQEDSQLGRSLLEDPKERLEHKFVVDYISEKLEGLGLTPNVPDEPRLKKFPNVQHIQTPISAKLSEDVHIMDVLECMHPTPAVGGTPLKKALEGIRELENFDRGLYAGTLGWFDFQGNSEFVVGIRSALIDQEKARLFVGGGIVEGSIPEKERKETDFKLEAMLKNLH